MSKFNWYLQKAIRMSPRTIIHKVFGIIVRRIHDYYVRTSDKCRSTYCCSSKQLNPIFYHNIAEASLADNYLIVAELNRHHYFDQLGSGWIKQKPDSDKIMLSKGGTAYVKSLQKIISPSYESIDWQQDFKSGYRWKSDTYYKDIEPGLVRGTDIKVPWELSRMHHLVFYACAYHDTPVGEKEKYVQEFQDEILDFIAQNPPRFGVCWRCTMDVGIRIANWLMAYDLFLSFGAVFSEEFEAVFARSVYDHANHIINNLEYAVDFTTNHYLSDIGGLLFAALHLASEPQTDAWLAFALQELISEMEREFHEDGTNIEASVSYHCLSTEIMLHCACLCQHISAERKEKLRHYQKELVKKKLIKKGPKLKPLEEQRFSLDTEYIFPEWFFERLQKALYFVEVCSDNGLIQQIGDVDSGRFLKLAPVFTVHTGSELKKKYTNLQDVPLELQRLYPDENLQNHYHLTQVLRTLQGNDDVIVDTLEMALVRESGIHFNNRVILVKKISQSNIDKAFENIQVNIPKSYTVQRYEFPLKEDYQQELEAVAYTGMGIYSFRSSRFHMLIRCGEVGQNGNGGHSHNDQLSLTLTLGGKQVIADPGSYLYTPDPVMRNKFRGTAMHFTPQPLSGMEQNEWENGQRGLFSIKKDRTKAQVLYFGRDGIIMRHDGFGTPVWRVVELYHDGIVVTDYGMDLKRWKSPRFFSNGYGKLIKVDSNAV